MKAKKSLCIVVDASVARAAGTSDNPTSSQCRQVLMKILEVCHRLVLSGDLRREWDRHQSSFFRTWRLSMISKKKHLHVPAPPIEKVLHAIDSSGVSDSVRREMTKDAHLVAAAISADRVVVTLEKRSRTPFERLGRSSELLKIHWVDPGDRTGAQKLTDL